MSNIAVKVRRNLEDYGWKVTLSKLLSFLFCALYLKRTYRIYMYDLMRNQSVSIDEDNLEYRLISSDEEPLISQIENMTEWLRGQLADKLENGNICLCALDKGTVAGYNIIAFNSIGIPLLKGVRILREKTAWSEQITVNKNYRRRGIAGKMRRQVFLRLKEMGYKRLYGGALISNKASLKLAEKLGFAMIADVTLIRIAMLKQWKYRRADNENL